MSREDEVFGRLVARTGGTLDDVLAHYGTLEHHGIKGMKWGVRRNRKQIDSSPDAPEHVRARQLHSVAKTAGTRKLSNKDLEDLTKRLNLEQNYGNLNARAKQKTTVSTGAKWMAKKVGKFGDMALDEVTKAHIRVQLHQKGLLPQIPKG